MRRALASEHGSVTAEFAALVPAVLLVLAFGMGGLEVVVQQVRVTDAAADAARSLARGDGAGAAQSRVETSAGASGVSVDDVSGFVCVTVSQRASGPLSLAGLTVEGKGCALQEASVGKVGS
jgi:Flp pilus assembly protein TadG